MYFETSGVTTSPILPPVVAFVISFFSSMGGVSGAFLLLPFQMSVLGYTAPSVSATNHLFNIVAIPSGVFQYIRENRMLWPLALVIVAAMFPGVFIGAIIRVEYLPDPTYFKAFAAAVLMVVGVRLVIETISAKTATQKKTEANDDDVDDKATSGSPQAKTRTKVERFTPTRLVYHYAGDRYDLSLISVFILCAAVGVVGGIYGIGGGAIIAPVLVSFYRLPVHTIAGAALAGTFGSSLAGVVFFQAISLSYPTVSVAPDWQLGLLFGVGGAAGMFLGARCQKWVPAVYIKWILAVVVLLTSLRYIVGLIF
jgi:uncharacterized protein